MKKPAQCFGPGAGQHKAKCRKDRPLCRWRRKEYASQKFGTRGPCQCAAYHFPHRPGAGDCSARSGGAGMPAELRAQERAYREKREAGTISSLIFESVEAVVEPVANWLYPPKVAPTEPSSRQVWVSRPPKQKSLCPHCRRVHKHHDWCASQKARA